LLPRISIYRSIKGLEDRDRSMAAAWIEIGVLLPDPKHACCVLLLTCPS
jgi:hypothetical protein